MDVRFTTSRFGAGYDTDEVDRFLDRCDRALATGDGSVTAEIVLETRFSVTRFREGYDMSEVDAFLDDVLAPRFRAAGTPASAGTAPSQAPSAATPPPSGTTPPSATTPPSGTATEAHPAEQRGGFLSRLLRGR